jgi:acetyl-CoA carboxylase biotin carboxyl carrier protein
VSHRPPPPTGRHHAGRVAPDADGADLLEVIAHTVRPLVSLVDKADIEELRVTHGPLRITIRKDAACLGAAHAQAGPAAVPAIPPAAPEPDAASTDEATPVPVTHTVRAGLVGFFYLTRPGGRGKTAPAIAVGDTVRAGQVVGYIEAMSVVSDVESDAEGEVTAILIAEGQPVEYGQPLIELQVAPGRSSSPDSAR